MVKIRLAKWGRKHDPFYRIVAIDETKKVTGMPSATLGFWNPRDKKLEIDKKEVKAWVGRGAKISPAVEKLLKA